MSAWSPRIASRKSLGWPLVGLLRAPVLVGLSLLFAVGCTKAAPCRPGTLFLDLSLSGASATADQLVVTAAVTGGESLSTDPVVYAGQSQFGLEVSFPSQRYPSGQSVQVTVRALRGDQQVGAGSLTTTLEPGCTQLALTLADGGPDLAAPEDGGADAPAPPDLLPASCGDACALYAVTPSLAAAGDVVTLEGNFGGETTVYFPGVDGGVPSTALSPGRVAATVPASATTGTLRVATTGAGGPLDGVGFRRAAYPLDVGRFDTAYPQTGVARPPTVTVIGRTSAATLVTNAFVYLLGGTDGAGNYLSSVERATINADDTLSGFSGAASNALLQARGGPTVITAGSHVYVLGGCSSSAHCVAEIERAEVNAYGELGAFQLGPKLNQVRCHASGALLGNEIYLFGGATNCNGDVPLNTIEHATIGPDGALSELVLDTDVKLLTARYQATAAVVGDSVYLVGGKGASATLGSVERARVAADGVLGPFADAGHTLLSPRASAAAAQFGAQLCLFGGSKDSTAYGQVSQASIECATRSGTSELSDFKSVSWSLATSTYAQAAALVGDTFYLFGGIQYTGTLRSMQRASLNGGGQLDPFAASTLKLMTPRSSHADFLLGNLLYLVGGKRYDAAGAASCNGAPCSIYGSVERVNVGSDGTLSNAVPNIYTLTTPRSDFGAAAIGGYVYVIGGQSEGGALATVERSTYYSHGTLAASFQPVAGVSLVTARRGFATAVTCSGDSPPACRLYVLGGADANGNNLQSIEYATIDANGNLSTFVSDTGKLVTARLYPASLVAGSALYLLGGCQQPVGTALATVERAPIQGDGSLGAFAVQSGSPLSTKRCGPSATLVGPRLYLTGGFDASASAHFLDSIESSLVGDTALGKFAAGGGLSTARQRHTSERFGNRLWLLGGDQDGPLTLDTVETAPLGRP